MEVECKCFNLKPACGFAPVMIPRLMLWRIKCPFYFKLVCIFSLFYLYVIFLPFFVPRFCPFKIDLQRRWNRACIAANRRRNCRRTHWCKRFSSAMIKTPILTLGLLIETHHHKATYQLKGFSLNMKKRKKGLYNRLWMLNRTYLPHQSSLWMRYC